VFRSFTRPRILPHSTKSKWSDNPPSRARSNRVPALFGRELRVQKLRSKSPVSFPPILEPEKSQSFNGGRLKFGSFPSEAFSRSRLATWLFGHPKRELFDTHTTRQRYRPGTQDFPSQGRSTRLGWWRPSPSLSPKVSFSRLVGLSSKVCFVMRLPRRNDSGSYFPILSLTRPPRSFITRPIHAKLNP